MRYLASSVAAEDARPWLFRVVTNLVRDDRRRRLRRGALLRRWWVGEEDPEASDAERSMAVARARGALDRLSERDRQMLLMREEGFSYAEIAEAAGVEASSVGTVLRRALQRFREAYEDP